MKYIKLIIFLIFVASCTTQIQQKDQILSTKTKFSNKGFALIYNDSSKLKKIISKKIDNRSLIVYQKKLKKNTSVKIINLLNNKSIIAKVGSNIKYPDFYNSVLSERIAIEIELNSEEPYVEISTIEESYTFVAKKAKTFDEEKQVANKAPVDGISINDLSSDNTKKIIEKEYKGDFKYIIKIADFYFKDSALNLKKRITNEYNMKNTKIDKISLNTYRVFIGPITDIESLKNAYNDISQLNFENIEIIKI